MRLFHFSEDPDIGRFIPRPVRVPSPRPPGRDWLNGPLVWAIDAAHQPMYLFPRECPRILLWPTPRTTPDDLAAFRRQTAARMVAYVEGAWLERLRAGRIHRYAFAPEGFESLDDAGMWVSRAAVEPLAMETFDDLPAALAAQDVDLKALPSLAPLRDAWSGSLHASGIRLRNAETWPQG